MTKPLAIFASFLSVFTAMCSIFTVIPDISYASPNQARNVTTAASVTSLDSSFESPDGFNFYEHKKECITSLCDTKINRYK